MIDLNLYAGQLLILVRKIRDGHMARLHTFDDPNRNRKGNVLFNNALNTFYLWLYGVRHMVKDHSNIEKGNPLLPHDRLTERVLLYAPSHRQDSTYHSLCYLIGIIKGDNS